jgi:hypothetical protein
VPVNLFPKTLNVSYKKLFTLRQDNFPAAIWQSASLCREKIGKVESRFLSKPVPGFVGKIELAQPVQEISSGRKN